MRHESKITLNLGCLVVEISGDKKDLHNLSELALSMYQKISIMQEQKE